MSLPEISLEEHAARRKKVLGSLKKAIGVVFAGESGGEDFQVHPHFEYLTGISDEAGAALLLDGTAPASGRREVLFLRPRDPEMERWDGFRPAIDEQLRTETGLSAIFRTGHMPRFITEAARRAKKLACLHPFAQYDAPVSPDLALFRRIAERVPGVAIEDHTQVLARLRARKSAKEVAMIRKAVDITARGYHAVLERLEPGLPEYAIQELLEHTYKEAGSRRGPGYGTIVGGGMMATVLHYRANSEPLQDGDLVCIDSAATFGSYTADVTRTFPVSGRFTDRQRAIYQIVLRAQEASIRAVKPGATLNAVDAAARKVIQKAGYGDYFIHGIGHHLGLEVHDVTPDGPLVEGAVVTIEPGIYLPEESLGVRIEDDVVVTKKGFRNLSGKIPKRVADIEKRMARGA